MAACSNEFYLFSLARTCFPPIRELLWHRERRAAPARARCPGVPSRQESKPTAACPGVFILNPSQWVLTKEITTSYYLIVFSQMLHMQPENSNIECAPHMFCVTLLFVTSCLPLQVRTNKTLPGSATRSPAIFFRFAGLSS